MSHLTRSRPKVPAPCRFGIMLVLGLAPMACRQLPAGATSNVSTTIVPIRESRLGPASVSRKRPRSTEKLVWGTPAAESPEEDAGGSDEFIGNLSFEPRGVDWDTEPDNTSLQIGLTEPEANSSGRPATAVGSFVPYDPWNPEPGQNHGASFLDEDASNGLGESVPELRFSDDLRGLWPMFRDDGLALVNWQTGLTLVAAGGAALATRNNLDHRVRDFTAEKPLRWGEGSEVLRQFGEFTYQVPVLFGVYGIGLWSQDEQFHDFSLVLASSYTLSAAATVAIKGITNTQRPSDQFEGGHYGFPSYHTSSTFSIAAVIDEYYGWQAALPAYALAGLVGWSRIDQREHDLSDVVFGAVLGVVIGKTVAAAHLDRRANLSITPYYDPKNHGTGIAVEKRY